MPKRPRASLTSAYMLTPAPSAQRRGPRPGDDIPVIHDMRAQPQHKRAKLETVSETELPANDFNFNAFLDLENQPVSEFMRFYEPVDKLGAEEDASEEMMDFHTFGDNLEPEEDPEPKPDEGVFLDYLERIFAAQAPPADNPRCATCGSLSSTTYRCDDCQVPEFLCVTCCNHRHCILPFHRIRSWNSSTGYLALTSSEKRGYVFSLGHNGSPCPTAGGDLTPMTILHTNGVHKLNVGLCRCTNDSLALQMIDHHIFPSSAIRPRSGFSFNVLDQFSSLNHTGKVTTWHYNQAMLHLSDGANTESTPTMYKQFAKVVREWHFLRLLQRSGRLHIHGLKPGALAIQCPCCPHPMEPKKENGDLLNALYLQGDGNFHLQQRAGRPNCAKDPSLVGDLGFWAPQKTFNDYVTICGAQEDGEEQQVACRSKAGDPSRSSKPGKLAVTGVYAISCRHVLFQPGGVIDFSKGERYHYVDVAVSNVMRQGLQEKQVPRIVFSYDINCKYSINYVRRVTEGDITLIDAELLKSAEIVWLVPKFHLGAHKPECADRFSFNFTPNTGRMSGELVETPWSVLNSLQWGSREMGWGARRDLITDHLNFWNWSGRIRSAHAEAAQAVENTLERLESIEGGLGEKRLACFKAEASTRGGEQYRPDSEKLSYPSRASILAMLCQEEQTQLLAANQDHTKLTLSSFVNAALDLQAYQINYISLLRQSLQSPPSFPNGVETAKQNLQRRIKNHHSNLIQLVPSLTNEICAPNSLPHEANILLPSSFNQQDRENLGLLDMAMVEAKLRVAFGHDILEKLRKALGVRSFLTRQVRAPHGYTQAMRAQAAVTRAQATIQRWREVYNENWAALRLLCVPLEELKELQELRKEDLVILSSWLEEEKYKVPGQNNKTALPWIWRIKGPRHPTGNTTEAVEKWNEEVVRLEWLHAAAAHERWKEELLLLKEEVRRLTIGLFQRAIEWRKDVPQQYVPCAGSQQGQRGFNAYARKQAETFYKLAAVSFSAYRDVNSLPPRTPPTWEEILDQSELLL